MIHFRRAALFVALSTCALAMSGARAAACTPADASLAGRYALSGVMEVGSEIELKPNGAFDYMLAYGALDELATGCWSRSGAVVTLAVSNFQNSMDDPMKFDRLDLTITPGGLLRKFDSHHSGRYTRY